MVTEVERLRTLIFQLLLQSECRTTDFLETLVGESVYPIVSRQQSMQTPDRANTIVRETCLLTELTGVTVSHNYVWIDPEAVPLAVYSKITQKKEGIGKILKALQTRTRREIIRSGFLSASETVDLFGQPLPLAFSPRADIPFKEYTITFSGYLKPGFHLLEYFNPDILGSPQQAVERNYGGVT